MCFEWIGQKDIVEGHFQNSWNLASIATKLKYRETAVVSFRNSSENQILSFFGFEDQSDSITFE